MNTTIIITDAPPVRSGSSLGAAAIATATELHRRGHALAADQSVTPPGRDGDGAERIRSAGCAVKVGEYREGKMGAEWHDSRGQRPSFARSDAPVLRFRCKGGIGPPRRSHREPKVRLLVCVLRRDASFPSAERRISAGG